MKLISSFCLFAASAMAVASGMVAEAEESPTGSEDKISNFSAKHASDVCEFCEAAGTGISREQAICEIPDVKLIDSHGTRVRLRERIEKHRGPIVLQFAFTSCSTLCPITTGTVSAARMQLGNADDGVLYLTLSIDPEFDTPERLREYAKNLGADRSWLFLTGEQPSMVKVQKAFRAYSANKARHDPLTFLRPGDGKTWTRITGLLSAKQLSDEVQLMLKLRMGDRSRVDASNGDPKIGKRIYQDGILPDGALVKAAVMSDVSLSGKNVACAKCHRRSGFGSDEPGKLVPPIVGEVLFKPRRFVRANEFRSLYQEPQSRVETTEVRSRSSRPAYDDEGLRRTLLKGISPGGVRLNGMMPRFSFSDAELQHLQAFLNTLGKADPGVNDDAIHFAYVTTADYNRESRRVALELLQAYAGQHNREVNRYRQRPGVSPHYKSEMIPSYRRWRIHTWKLRGSPDSYSDQLQTFLGERPVFAMLSGGGNVGWKQVADFGEANRLPILFPDTELPTIESENQFSIYIDRGIFAHAEALAGRIQNAIANNSDSEHQDILQVVGDSLIQKQGAEHLASLLRVEPVTLKRVRPKDFFDSQKRNRFASDAWVVLWCDSIDEFAPPAITGSTDVPTDSRLVESLRGFGAANLFIACRDIANLEDRLRDDRLVAAKQLLELNASFSYPYALQSKRNVRSHRVRGWLRARGLPLENEPLQQRVFFALTVTDHALTHMVDRYSREYLIERIEHETENSLNPGLYTQLSLGPGQRFASKRYKTCISSLKEITNLGE